MKNFLFVPLVFFAACSGTPTQQTRAYIIERKMMNDGKLMISYVFHAEDKPFSDSEEVANSIIPQDSVTVVYREGNPQKNQLKY